jgi:hypothetical protein
MMVGFYEYLESEKPSFGFISTRSSGLDGVLLETNKWVDGLNSKTYQKILLTISHSVDLIDFGQMGISPLFVDLPRHNHHPITAGDDTLLTESVKKRINKIRKPVASGHGNDGKATVE